MVGAIQKEARQQRGVASNKARPHARDVGSFGKAGETDQPPEVGSAKQTGGLQPAQGRGRFVKIDFRIALSDAITKPYWSERSNSNFQSSSDITLPAGLPGEQTKSRRVRAQTAASTRAQSQRKLRVGSELT